MNPRFDRRRRDGKRRDNRFGFKKKKEPRIIPDCPYCNEPIRDLYSAIGCKETGAPAHFDCVIANISREEKLQPDEKVCYLGNGSFGIVQVRNPQSPLKFFIRKRIEYERSDQDKSWRKQLSTFIR